MPLKPAAEWTEADLPPSIALPWDPENLAQIVVSPYAPAWYLERLSGHPSFAAPRRAIEWSLQMSNGLAVARVTCTSDLEVVQLQ